VGGAQPVGGEGSPSNACVTSTMLSTPQSCSRTRSTTLRLASMQNTTRALDVRMMWASDHAPDISKNPVVKWISSHMRVTKELHDERFFVKVPDEKTGKLVRAATPLFLALVVINLADLVFAVDSVPAIFAITTDTFIVYTSNIMAILGLRALYFALAAMIHRFQYLKYALAAVLVFIGSKIFVTDFVLGGDKFPPVASLAVTFGLIAAGVFYSLWKTRGDDDGHGTEVKAAE